MSVTFSGTVTRNSNGSVDVRPSKDDASTLGIDRVVVHSSSNIGSKRLAVDDVVEVTITKSKAVPAKVPATTKTAKRQEARAAKLASDSARASRAADAARAKGASDAAARAVDDDGN